MLMDQRYAIAGLVVWIAASPSSTTLFLFVVIVVIASLSFAFCHVDLRGWFSGVGTVVGRGENGGG
jgi:hypothetical protein